MPRQKSRDLSDCRTCGLALTPGHEKYYADTDSADSRPHRHVDVFFLRDGELQRADLRVVPFLRIAESAVDQPEHAQRDQDNGNYLFCRHFNLLSYAIWP